MILTCRKLIKVLDDYVEGRMSPMTRKRFEMHLKMCSACRDYVASYRRTIREVHEALRITEADCEQMPDELVQAIVDAAAAQKR